MYFIQIILKLNMSKYSIIWPVPFSNNDNVPNLDYLKNNEQDEKYKIKSPEFNKIFSWLAMTIVDNEEINESLETQEQYDKVIEKIIKKKYKYNNHRFLDKEKYWDIFRTKNYSFHALRNANEEKIRSILNDWILTKKSLIEKKWQDFWWTINNHNGLGHVSISRAPLFNYYWNWSASSLSKYTLVKWWVSFILDNTHLNTRWKIEWWESWFYDEYYVYWDIDPNKIKWIIVDEEILTKNILNNEWKEELAIFIFWKIIKEFNLKLYNQKWFEINI